jgi:Flp pilus assembly protein TadG
VRENAATAPGPGGPSGDRGISAVEVVLLTPLLVFFMLMLVAFGQQTAGRSAVDGAARDAARAGSLERDLVSANAAAERVARAQLGDICVGGTVAFTSNNQVGAGDLYQVTVGCQIKVLDMLWLPARRDVSGTSAAPVDPYRRSDG